MPRQVATDLDMGGAARVTNLPAPVNPNDAARKADVDALGGVTPLGLWDFWSEHWFSTSGANAGVFVGTAVAGGSVSTGVSFPVLGYNPYGAFLRSGTTANGGYRFQTTFITDYFGIASRKFIGQFAWRTSFTDRTVRLGFHDTATVTDAVDGAYFEIVGDVCSAKTANNSVRTTNATTLTLTLNTPYTFHIDVNAAGTEVRFRVFEGTNETPVMDVSNTTNIPNTSARMFGAGICATEAGTTASDIGILYRMGVGTVEAYQRATGRT